MSYNIKTSCQECVFAVYNDKTQTGCKANRLEKLEIVECYNENGEFFAAINYPCNLYRTTKWAKKKNPADLLEIAEKEIAFNYTVITSAEDFEDKLKILDAQSIQPQKIYCFSEQSDIKIRRPNIEYVTFISNVKDPIHRIISRIKKATNILYLDKKEVIHDFFIENLNYLINKEMCKKTIFFSTQDSSFIMPSVYYRVYPTYTYSKILQELSNNVPEAIGYFEEI